MLPLASCLILTCYDNCDGHFLVNRRDYVRKALVYMTVGKSSEAVRYQRVSVWWVDHWGMIWVNLAPPQSRTMLSLHNNIV